MSGERKFATLAILVATLPSLSLADVTGTTTLTANMALNLDNGGTSASGGDLLWNGSTLAPQGSATAFFVGALGASYYNFLNQAALAANATRFSSAPIRSAFLVVDAVIEAHTNGGNFAKLLVTSNTGGSLTLQFTTYSAPSAPAPSITALQNAASNVPPGLPNAGIAQGSMFVVKGANLGPTAYTQAASFPLPAAVGGTSITVTVGNTTVSAIMFYSLSVQVAAILPSKTPIGTGTLTLTYNKQTATAPITVVESNIGIYTVSQSGFGDAIAFLHSDSQLVTPTHAANPGDIVVFWGTGLGPVAFDETQPAIQTDMTNVPLQVYIGGHPATINFRGRNGCCSSADTIYVTVPPEVRGCAVSVVMQVGNIVSNSTSIAIAQEGRTCALINGNLPVSGTGSSSSARLSLYRNLGTIAKSDSARAVFQKITYPSIPPTGWQQDGNSLGSCSVSTYMPGQTYPSSPFNSTSLDAGPTITLDGPFGTKSLPKFDVGYIRYEEDLDRTATTLTPGTYTFTAAGGPDVGPFIAKYTLPPFFVWTNQSTTTTVDRASGLTVTWSGGNPAGYVYISGSSSVGTVSASFTCTARVSDGMFTVPPVVLLGLAPSGSPNEDSLIVSTSDAQPFPPPLGLDAASVESSFSFANLVTYR